MLGELDVMVMGAGVGEPLGEIVGDGLDEALGATVCDELGLGLSLGCVRCGWRIGVGTSVGIAGRSSCATGRVTAMGIARGVTGTLDGASDGVGTVGATSVGSAVGDGDGSGGGAITWGTTAGTAPTNESGMCAGHVLTVNTASVDEDAATNTANHNPVRCLRAALCLLRLGAL